MMDSSTFVEPADLLTEYNARVYVIRALMAQMATAMLVRVMKVTNSGALTPVGFVDILPLVSQQDGAGLPVLHETIYNCPYVRIQGGANAVILDPQVGDIGIAVFADRDITTATTSAVAQQAGPPDPATLRIQSLPGSGRMFSMSDGLYIGGVLNQIPTQYVQFSAAGIKIVSPVAIELDAPDVKLVAPTVEINASSSMSITTPTLTVNGNVSTTGTLKNNSISVGSIHTHPDPQGGNTGTPNP